jgi:hypothetical protein
LPEVINGKNINHSGKLNMIKKYISANLAYANGDSIRRCLKNKEFREQLEYRYGKICNISLFVKQYSGYLK